MPYSAEISRRNPTCFLFLIDQSGSMSAPFGNAVGLSKAQALADAINRLLDALVDRCTKGEQVLDRYFIGVIGYGARVDFALGGALQGRSLVPVSELAQHPLRVEDRKRREYDGAGGLVEVTMKFPIWFEPQADNGTPMRAALERARQVVADFVQQHPNCYPPLVFHITDGEATDASPPEVEQAGRAVQAVSSQDGAVLLFNMHLSDKPVQPIWFPVNEHDLPDDFARLLFRMSSELPAPMLAAARRLLEGQRPLQEHARGFVFNADLVSVIQFLDIGTRPDASR
jgi:hypothetical protein